MNFRLKVNGKMFKIL